jgi:hypothetical protein
VRRLHQTLTCAVLLTLSLTGQSQAGVFDFLFGGQQQQLGSQRPVYVPAYAPPSRPTLMRPKVHDRIRKVSASVDGDVPKNAREATLANIRKLDTVAKTEGIKAAFLKDQTARPGDILVTAEGLSVYERGAGGAQLRPLAESRYKDRTDLQMLQKVGNASRVKNPDVATHEASNDQTPRSVRTAEISQ